MRHSDNTVLFNNYSYTARYLAAAQCIVIGPVCGFVIVGRRAVSEPYYSQCARSVCVSLSAFFIMLMKVCILTSCNKGWLINKLQKDVFLLILQYKYAKCPFCRDFLPTPGSLLCIFILTY